MNPRPAIRCRSAQRGVGLIEVLVAVLILSIGLLGIALVQTRSLSANNSSMARSMAVVASYSILDALRADRVNAIAGSYNETISADDCDYSGSLANAQLAMWCSELSQNLGDTATGVINCLSSGVCVITITYDDSRAGTSNEDEQTVQTKASI